MPSGGALSRDITNPAQQRRPVLYSPPGPAGALASNLSYPRRAVCGYDDAHGRHTALATRIGLAASCGQDERSRAGTMRGDDVIEGKF
jgi:hypothetical protein